MIAGDLYLSSGSALWMEGQSILDYDGSYLVVSGPTRVGIGTWSPMGKLDVNGTIYQRGSMIHADYVFEDGFQIESIQEHASFMWREKHLPAVPKSQTDENGFDIVEYGAHLNGILEELEKSHVYIEQLLERIQTLEVRIDAIQQF